MITGRAIHERSGSPLYGGGIESASVGDGVGALDVRAGAGLPSLGGLACRCRRVGGGVGLGWGGLFGGAGTCRVGHVSFAVSRHPRDTPTPTRHTQGLTLIPMPWMSPPTLYKARQVPTKQPVCAICVDRTRGR